MTVSLKMQYPGDPPATVELMFGREFLARNPERFIRFINLETGKVEETIPVDDVVCDSCNALIGPSDPCCLQEESRLYCWSCFKEWVWPYLPKEDK